MKLKNKNDKICIDTAENQHQLKTELYILVKFREDTRWILWHFFVNIGKCKQTKEKQL